LAQGKFRDDVRLFLVSCGMFCQLMASKTYSLPLSTHRVRRSAPEGKLKPLETWIIAVISALAGMVGGALASAGANHWFWRKQHQIVAQESEERAKRERKEQVLERLRSTGGELIELLREPLYGPHIDQRQSETLRYIEMKRLSRELLALWGAAENVLPSDHAKLQVIRQCTAEALIRPTKDKLDQLVALFDDLYRSA
jgi:hypothetical protein